MGRRIDPDTLLRQLQDGTQPDPLYVISGDEILLVTELLDALRTAARQAGYTERNSLVMDARSDWSELTADAQNISLFGDRKLLELKLPSGKPGKAGAEALIRLANQTAGSSDLLTLVALPRLDKTTRQTKWATALWDAATVIEPPTIGRHELPRWIGQRLQRQGQSADAESLAWVADRVEGNLLAAHQEIMKLGLLYPEGRLSDQDIQQAVLNVARYDVFALRDAMLAGESRRALTILDGLKSEGEALPLVLWAVGEEIRVLARLAIARAQGQPLGQAMRAQRIFGTRESLVGQTLNRVHDRVWPAAVQHAHDIDRLIKGVAPPGRLHDPWEELSRLILRITVPQS